MITAKKSLKLRFTIKLNEKIKYRVIVIVFSQRKASLVSLMIEIDGHCLLSLQSWPHFQVVHEFLNTSMKVGGLGLPKWVGQCYQNSGPVPGRWFSL